ncbi:MAG: alpha/beta fold hydrolase [Acidimicrobiia bacterium]
MIGRPRRRRRRLTWFTAIAASIAVALGIGAVPAGHRPTSRPAAASAPSPSASTGSVTVVHVRTGNGATRAVWVYRPAVPDSASLPVVYFLHGVPGTARSVFDAGIVRELDDAIRRSGRPFVFVSPDGNGTSHEDTEWADALDGSDLVETDLLDRVVPAVEGAHRRDRAHRAIAGFSMGGYGAVNLAEHHADRFGQVVSISGYFHVDDPDLMFGDDPDTETANESDRHAASLARTRVMLLEGADDDEPVVKGEAARFGAVLDAAHVAHELRIDPGTHHWSFVIAEAPVWLDFLERGWAPLP